jgi:sulfite exporter TauE/SafE
LSDQGQFEFLISHWSFFSIPVAVFMASLLGSSHCVSMCGPIAITVHNDNGYLSLYHFGRLLSYLLLGILAGYFGEAFLSSKYPIIAGLSVSIISFFLIFAGLRLIRQKPLDLIFSRKVSNLLSIPFRWSLRQKPMLKSLAIGIVNGFLPCGWVYIFVLGAIATKDSFYGGLLLAIFWVGTVPALTVFPFFYKKTLARFPRKINQVAGIVLILLGISVMAIHILQGNSPISNIHHIHRLH